MWCSAGLEGDAHEKRVPSHQRGQVVGQKGARLLVVMIIQCENKSFSLHEFATHHLQPGAESVALLPGHLPAANQSAGPGPAGDP